MLAASSILNLLDAAPPERLAPTWADVRGQLHQLVFPGFVAAVGGDRLTDLSRYLAAAAHRLDTARNNVRRDHEAMLAILELEREHHRLVELLPGRESVEAIGWQLQELRVARFAQHLGAKGPVSEKRLRTALRRALDHG